MTGRARDASFHLSPLSPKTSGVRDAGDAISEHEDTDVCGDVPGAQPQSVALLHDISPGTSSAVAEQDMARASLASKTLLKLNTCNTQEADTMQHLCPQYRDEHIDEVLPDERAAESNKDEFKDLNDKLGSPRHCPKLLATRTRSSAAPVG